ncbi:MAG TPA: hypothetical protein VFT56_17075 [Sphingomonas sp.]|nr:hypothetical protein [Sphingomonas sp.]
MTPLPIAQRTPPSIWRVRIAGGASLRLTATAGATSLSSSPRLMLA